MQIEIYEPDREKATDKTRTREMQARAQSARAFQRATVERMRNWSMDERLIRTAEHLSLDWWTRQVDLDRAIRRVSAIVAERKERGARVDRKAEISPCTEKLYRRAWDRIGREIQVGDACAVVEHLRTIARGQSRSSYRLARASVLRHASAYVVAQVRAMPSYGDLCAELGRAPSRIVGAITRDRRRTRDQAVIERIMARLRPETRDAVQALRLLGCRAGELETAVVEGSAVTLATLKHMPGDARTLAFDAESAEGRFLLAHQGAPWAGMGAERLRKAWSRARAREGLANTQQYCLHAFRHECASRWKKDARAAMIERYGADWLSGCQTDEDQRRRLAEYRSPVSARLGHSCTRSTALYGHTRGK